MDDRFSWTLLAVSFVFTACNSSGNQPVQGSRYRDIKGYFQQELVHIEKAKPAMHKTVSLNEQRDSVTITTPDSAKLQNMLQPFLEVDLGKPSLRDAYDTILLPNQFTGKSSLMYRARNKNTIPQEVILNLDSEQHIESVQMNKHVRNLIYEYQQNLEYEHNRQIHINTWQKIAFLPSKELDVKILLTAQP